MPVWLRYTLFQIPGVLLVGVLAALLHLQLGVALPIAAAVVGLWLLKDVVVYPLVRTSYATDVATGSERMIGREGWVVDGFSEEGYVRVGGERWRARADAQSAKLLPGQAVRVVASEGMCLVVTESSTRPAKT